MRHPQRWLRISLGFVIAGLLAGAAAFALPPGMASDPVRTTLFIVGLMAVIVGGFSFLACRQALRSQRALARGDDVVARWHIEPARWKDFVALDQRLNQAPGALLNELAIRDELPSGGVDVVVGKDAVEIDGSVHDVPRRGTPEITHARLVSDAPDYVELQLFYPGGGVGASGVTHPPRRTALRFPVAPTSWRDARTVVANFSGLLPQEADFFHGKGDGSQREDLNTCATCGYQTHRYMSTCPRCRGSMLTRRWARRFGAVIALGGAIVTGIMGPVMFYNTRLLLHPRVAIDGSRFNGSWPMALLVLGIFVLVLAFGLTALGYGTWQTVTGRRNWTVVRAMVIGWSILLAVAIGIARFAR